ncbi:MAG: DUF962 domain-containing protein [Archangium sp.]|nr:DUF962 domain-containing protein [Archangium sp.]
MNAPMNPLTQQLGKYATYHRDPRNITTHFFGVPMIVLAVTSFLSRPGFELFGLALSPVWFVVAAAAVFYFRLDVRFGLTMTALLIGAAFVSSFIAAQSTLVWLIVSAGLFIVGWVIQFIGHYYEGKKPAFVDDLVGLLLGPLFVTAEVAFAIGLRLELKAAMEQVAGPTKLRQLDGGSPSLSK